jgi:hypothetical protein
VKSFLLEPERLSIPSVPLHEPGVLIEKATLVWERSHGTKLESDDKNAWNVRLWLTNYYLWFKGIFFGENTSSVVAIILLRSHRIFNGFHNYDSGQTIANPNSARRSSFEMMQADSPNKSNSMVFNPLQGM